ncbi:MAG: hypothetical protein ABIL40_11655, partial [candidate division WOR-3 bacterium]
MVLILTIINILVSPALREKLSYELCCEISKASPDEMIDCIVIMKESYPYEVMEAYPIKERIRTYREIAELSQTPL